MTETKALVKALLQSPYALKWSVQGLGMMRTYLSDEIRLHIWDSTLKVPNASPLHTHPWHLHSTVVAGIYIQRRYTQPLEVSDRTLEFNSALIKCGAGACALEEKKKVQLEATGLEYYEEDQSYYQHSSEIHYSTPTDGTVTLVTRTFTENRDNARVFWTGDGEFVSAEPRPATLEEVKRVTEASLGRWFK